MKMDSKQKGTDLSNSPKDVTIEGTYHCAIMSVREFTTKKGGLSDLITLEVLAGDVPKQETLRAAAFLNRKPGTGEEQWTEGHTRWAWAAGLISPGQEIEFKPSMLEGHEVVAHISVNEETHRANVSNFYCDVWPVNAPEVAAIPKAKPTDAFGEVKPAPSEDVSNVFG